jgi:hypothetical protein
MTDGFEKIKNKRIFKLMTLRQSIFMNKLQNFHYSTPSKASQRVHTHAKTDIIAKELADQRIPFSNHIS